MAVIIDILTVAGTLTVLCVIFLAVLLIGGILERLRINRQSAKTLRRQLNEWNRPPRR